MIKSNLNKAIAGNLDLGTDTVIDPFKANFFYNNISANKTYSTTHMGNGCTIILVVKNTGGSTITLTFPPAFKKSDSFSATVDAGKQNVYTLLQSNGEIIINSVAGIA